MHGPTLMFHPRPGAQSFPNPLHDGSGFACATRHLDCAEHKPLVTALPALLLVPLAPVGGPQPAPDPRLAELDGMRCGTRLLADCLVEGVLIWQPSSLIDHPGADGVGSGLIAGMVDPRPDRLLVALHATSAEGGSRERMAGTCRHFAQAFAVASTGVTAGTLVGCLSDWRLTRAMSELRHGVASRNWRWADPLQHDP